MAGIVGRDRRTGPFARIRRSGGRGSAASPASSCGEQRRLNRTAPLPAVFPVSHYRMMPEKRSKGNPDPSRGRGDGGICAAGRDDRAFLPGFADGGCWRGGAARGALRSGRPRCSNVVPGRSAGRSRTPRDIRLPDKRVAEEPPRPADPCALPGRAGQRRPIMAS